MAGRGEFGILFLFWSRSQQFGSFTAKIEGEKKICQNPVSVILRNKKKSGGH